jgi:hypothetical protein
MHSTDCGPVLLFLKFHLIRPFQYLVQHSAKFHLNDLVIFDGSGQKG